VLTAIARVFFKFAALRLPELVTNWQLLAGFALYGIATLILLYAFRLGEVSVLFPLYATSFIWVAFASALFFGEALSFSRWAGIALIVLGTVLIGTAKHRHGQVSIP
jgi:drug/metabolite transporter (DMT)-like permease